MYIFVWLSHFTVQNKFAQHCKSSILQFFLKKKHCFHFRKYNCFPLCLLWFLGLHLQHMEVPVLGADLEPQQGRIWAASETYTTAQGNDGSLTHWARPGIEPASSWTLVRFLTHWATMGTPVIVYFLEKSKSESYLTK